MCALFVPHLSMPDQKHHHIASSVEFVEMIDDSINVLKRIVMDDEFWCFMYDPETKHQKLKPKTEKVRMQKLQVKTMLTAFFDVRGIIHHELCWKNRL
jgi:hypothetical protein